MQIDKTKFNLKEFKMGFFPKMIIFTAAFGAFLKFVVGPETIQGPAWLFVLLTWIVGLGFISLNEND